MKRRVVKNATIVVQRYTPNWASHLPILTRVMQVSTGSVMECGIGVHSTPFLHSFCTEQKRKLFSYEDNEMWYQKHWAWINSFHSIEFITDWDTVPIEKQHWGVIFIDHTGERRAIEAIRASKHADFVILHDTNGRYEKLYHYEKVYPFFKYRYIYNMIPNHTTVLSNFIPVDKIWMI